MLLRFHEQWDLIAGFNNLVWPHKSLNVEWPRSMEILLLPNVTDIWNPADEARVSTSPGTNLRRPMHVLPGLFNFKWNSETNANGCQGDKDATICHAAYSVQFSFICLNIFIKYIQYKTVCLHTGNTKNALMFKYKSQFWTSNSFRFSGMGHPWCSCIK